jgi:peptidoglycan-N-acetylglucosamine deacetylase
MMRAAILGCWVGALCVVATAVCLKLYWALIVLLPPLALTLWATFVPQSGWWGPVLYRFTSRYREVLLSFDLAPDPEETPAVLVLLERYKARGMFLVDLERAKAHPELVKEIVRRGHGVACALSRRTRWVFSPTQVRAELTDCMNYLHELVPDYPLQWFALPGSIVPPWLHPLLDKLEIKLLGYSADDGGLLLKDMEHVLRSCRRDVGKGGVVRFHHGQHDLRGESSSTEVLEEMLIWFRGQGYSLGT